MFTKEDFVQMEEHGLTPAALETQLKNFREGFPFLPVTRAASCGDGIRVLDAAGIEQAAARYDRAKESLRVVKFVPASGAATRMFKDLFEFVREGRRTAVVGELLANRRRFAFWPELRTIIGDDADELRTVENIVAEGLRYGETPKGLVSFHRYGDEVRKAVEEHLVEGAQYAAAGGEVKIHFTVSPEHLTRFEALLAEKIPGYESRFGVKYRISFSVQDPSTDTLAVNPDCTPFRRADGRLLFRPAGHGALIGNLGKIDADIVFVKNIDNVTTDARRSDTVLYKKALAGVLLALQERIFEYLMALEVPGAELEPIAAFIENELCVKLPKDYGTALLRQVLDRPIRVCGMVRNEGEPGGGPFWVAGADGLETLQIAESNQIAPEKRELMRSATHFNPVDLVCSFRTSKGGRFDLREFVDPATGFISRKSDGGRELLAQELPGLWNGAMARWNTVFVEVPITTFSPVKVVTDLLRPEHQGDEF
ncbi:MAG TPA: DUF4301 domain-containing protein [Alistipes putredinis]|jgi:hypothetical protein|uniref:DUF4301 domain-containing protein n=13 Tax=Alistipes TaxID=239759 RepID=B0N033_9BACT|nr:MULTISPECIES: DUF4301 family protein [Alistipes]EDS03219.1 hypothetical protein ALIPUT_02760 [Alistipes putredinis DSM 17216]MBE5686914.1 DUF4301 family protein [Alistipes sp.]MBE5690502.1 DUF4301 family protein [Alistipes sp.]MBP8652801.1 DUF4301 family protein [Alistipes sp.]MBT9918902.1 DUF4301 family protein [Alistipes putredinis]